jgi:hypothetical protein
VAVKNRHGVPRKKRCVWAARRASHACCDTWTCCGKKPYASGQLDETRHFYYTEPSRWQVV